MPGEVAHQCFVPITRRILRAGCAPAPERLHVRLLWDMEDLETYRSRVKLYRARAKSIRQQAEAASITKRRRLHLLRVAEQYERAADGIERERLGKG
jgi:hypothetical protein